MVRYGAGSTWTDNKEVSGSFPCSSKEFGQPEGKGNTCQCMEKKEEKKKEKKGEKEKSNNGKGNSKKMEEAGDDKL